MSYIDRIKVGNTTHLIEPTLYTECTTAAVTATKQTAAIDNFSLIAGVQVAVKFTVTNTAAVSDLKLQIGTTTAKSIKYRGGNLPSVGTLTANHIYNFVYDGTNWELVGDLDTNTQSNYGNITTSGKIGTGNNLVVTSSGTVQAGATISNAISTQTTSTKFLREDGTWAVPSYTTNTDEKVSQIGSADDKNFPIILKNTDGANETSVVKYSNNTNTDVTKTKPFTFNPSTGTLTVSQIKIGTKDDNMGLFPNLNNWNQIGSSSLYWYRAYINNYYGNNSHVTNWDAGKNIGTAATSSAAATKGSVNFYNTASAGATQTKTLLEVNTNTNSNITITLPSSTGSLALISDVPTKLSDLEKDLTYSDFGAAATSHGTHVTTATVKSALGTVGTTDKKFLKDTGDWVQVAYTDLTGVPTSFTPAEHTHSHLVSLATINSGDSENNTHAAALKKYFDENKSTIPRNSLVNFYSSAYSNGSQAFGYWLSSYDNNPYGGFFVAHYNTPKYVGILNGTYTQVDLITSGTIGSQSVNYANSAGTAGSATTAGAFSSGTTVKLTGDTTGESSSSTKGWSVSTTTKYLSGTAEADPALTTAPGTGKIRYSYNVSTGTTGLFDTVNNANSIITLNKHAGNYDSQLGFSSNGNIYYRNFNIAALNNTTAWKQLAFTDSTVTRATADADGNTITSTYAPLASPTFTGTPKAPTAANGTSTTQIATTEFVNNTLAYANAMTFKGTLGTGGTVTALPASHNAGDTYRVITAGTWAGKYCEVGTLIICTTDGTSANDAHWTSVETNEDGAVIGPSSSTTNSLAFFNSTTGRVIDSTSKITVYNDVDITVQGATKKRNGIRLSGTCYGNTAADLTSNTVGVMRYEDGGVRIEFSADSSDNAALLYTNHDKANTGGGSSFHFVGQNGSNDTGGNLAVTAPDFVARRRLMVGKNFTDASYTAYINGTSYLNGATTINYTTAASSAKGSSQLQICDSSTSAPVAAIELRRGAINNQNGKASWQIINDRALKFAVDYSDNAASQATTYNHTILTLDYNNPIGISVNGGGNFTSDLTVGGTTTLNGNTTISAATPVLQIKSTGTNAATLGLIRNGLSSWQWVNSGGNLYLQNNWDSASGKAVNYFNVVTYAHTYGTVEIHKNLAVGGTSTFSDEATLTKANGGANFGIYVNHTNPNSDTSKAKKIALMVGGSSGSGGLYDSTKSKWIVYSDTAGNVTLNGNALTADSATIASTTGKGTHTATVAVNEFSSALDVGTMTVVGNVSNTSMPKTNNANAELIVKAHPTSGSNYYEARLGFSSNGALYYMPVNATTWQRIAYQAALGDYLPLEGGNMTGKIYSSAVRKLQWTTSDTDNNADGASWYGLGTFDVSENGTTYPWICLSNYWGLSFRARDDSHVKINGNIVLNAANYSSYALPLSGGTMTGDIKGNQTVALGTITNPFHNIVLGGEVTATMTAASTNPRITFQSSNNGTQQVHLIYSNYDSYRAPAGLKIIGENTSGDMASPAWLEVEGDIYAAAFKGNADTATSATTATYLGTSTRMDYGWFGINYYQISAANQSAAKVNDTPYSTATWTHILRFNHGNTAGYYTDLAIPFNGNSIYFKRIANGTLQNSTTNGGWVKVLDQLNYSSYALPLSGGTLSGDLSFKNGTSNDTPDLSWWYGNNTEQARIWMGSGSTAKWAPLYRCYKSDGTQLYSGSLVLGDGTGASGTWGISISGNATTAASANQVLRWATNETAIGADATPANATNDSIWFNYRSGYGGATNDAATQLKTYYFGDRKGQYNTTTIYAGTFSGALSGNATSATKAKVTSVAFPTSGSKTYYLTFTTSTTTGNQDLNNSARLYLFENTGNSALNIGSSSTSGAITLHNANGKYADIVSSAFTANRTLTLPDATGTIALTSSNITGNAATASKVSATLNQTAKTYLLGTQTAITATAANVSLTGDTGVYLTTTAGELSAYRYSWHYSTTERAYTLWNDTDQSIDFIFI